MHNNQRGALHLVAIILVIVLGLVGFVGYKVWSSAASKSAVANPEGSDKVVEAAPEKAWKEGDFAVAGTYADASVVQIENKKWRLYYAIQPEVQGNNFEVYSSTSTDGKTWAQEPGTRKTMATFPEVIKTSEGKYRMYYQNAGEIRSASSTDGLLFTDDAGTRIDRTNSLGLTFDNVAAPAVSLLDDKTYLMVYRGTMNNRYAADTPNPTTQVLLWATSEDGLTFTKQGMAVDSRDDTLRGQLDGPYIVKWDDDKYHVFATTYSGVYEFIFDGKKFGKGTLAFALATDSPLPVGQNVRPPDVAPPGDPTIAKINDTWFMYYGGSRDKNGIRYATYE